MWSSLIQIHLRNENMIKYRNIQSSGILFSPSWTNSLRYFLSCLLFLCFSPFYDSNSKCGNYWLLSSFCRFYSFLRRKSLKKGILINSSRIVDGLSKRVFQRLIVFFWIFCMLSRYKTSILHMNITDCFETHQRHFFESICAKIIIITIRNSRFT